MILHRKIQITSHHGFTLDQTLFPHDYLRSMGKTRIRKKKGETILPMIDSISITTIRPKLKPLAQTEDRSTKCYYVHKRDKQRPEKTAHLQLSLNVLST